LKALSAERMAAFRRPADIEDSEHRTPTGEATICPAFFRGDRRSRRRRRPSDRRQLLCLPLQFRRVRLCGASQPAMTDNSNQSFHGKR